MEPNTISSKAKWTLQELIPLIIAFGIGLGGITAYITGYFVTAGAVMTMLFGFGLFFFLIFINVKRKNKSILYATLSNDKNFNIDIWMNKPLKDKWQGKLDKGKNKGALSNLRSIKMDEVRGTRVVLLKLQNGKAVMLPVRLAIADEIRTYLAKAIEARGSKVNFENPGDAEEFKGILIGEVAKKSAKAAYVAPTTVPTLQNTKKKAEPKVEEKTIEPVLVEEKEDSVDAAPVVPKKKIGYGSVKSSNPVAAVNKATEKIAEEEPVKADISHNIKDSLLLGVDKEVSSVSVPVEVKTEDK